ncbi:MAG: ATP synthase F1 subunit delta [Acidobacteriota bacterium]
MIRRFATPYAKALAEIVPSAEEAQVLIGQLQQFEKARSGAPDLQELFSNPGVDLETKLNIVGKLAERLAISDTGRRLLGVLVRNHRINDLQSVLGAWQKLVNDQLGVAVADVRTAHTLDSGEENRLRAALEEKFGKRMQLKIVTDPSLIAGFVAQVGSDVYDASTSGQIDKFRLSLEE